MPKTEHEPSVPLIGRVISWGTFAAAGWVLFSRFGVDHAVPLPNAIDSERKQYASSRAGTLSYYVDVAGDDKPLVLLHSINAAPSAYEIKPLFEHYRGKRPVYALDLPGFGFSDRHDVVYSPDLYADVILEFVREIVGTTCDVVALSLTSEFVARAALSHPNWFRSLAFISPTGFNANEIKIPESLYGIFSFPLWAQAFFDLVVTKPSIRYFLGKSFVGDMPEGIVEYAHATAHQPGARHAPLYFVGGRLFTTYVRREIYEKISVNTLVLYDQDPNISFEQLPDLLTKNSAWQAIRLKPSLGLPHWERLEETVEILDDYWASS